jgi:hypothetical protein
MAGCTAVGHCSAIVQRANESEDVMSLQTDVIRIQLSGLIIACTLVTFSLAFVQPELNPYSILIRSIDIITGIAPNSLPRQPIHYIVVSLFKYLLIPVHNISCRFKEGTQALADRPWSAATRTPSAAAATQQALYTSLSSLNQQPAYNGVIVCMPPTTHQPA